MLAGPSSRIETMPVNVPLSATGRDGGSGAMHTETASAVPTGVARD